MNQKQKQKQEWEKLFRFWVSTRGKCYDEFVHMFETDVLKSEHYLGTVEEYLNSIKDSARRFRENGFHKNKNE